MLWFLIFLILASATAVTIINYVMESPILAAVIGGVLGIIVPIVLAIRFSKNIQRRDK